MRLPWRRRRARPVPYTRADLISLWIDAGGSPGTAGLAAAVALAESGGVPDAVASDFRVGLWQPPVWEDTPGVRLPAWPLLWPRANALATIVVTRDGRDWSGFGGYLNGAYQRYLTG